MAAALGTIGVPRSTILPDEVPLAVSSPESRAVAGCRCSSSVRAVRDQLVRALLSGDGDVRRWAVEAVATTGVQVGRAVRVLVVSGTGELSEHMAERLREDAMRNCWGRGHVVAHDGRLVVLWAEDAPADGSSREMRAWCDRMVATAAPWGVDLRVGIGGRQEELGGAEESHRQALAAVWVAERVSGMGPVLTWDAMGVYRLLMTSAVPVDAALVHPGVAAAARAGHNELLHSAEVYLDCAGRMGEVTDRLRLHRGSVYYRLRRFEEVTGCDLDDGTARLAAHMALKALRLDGAVEPRLDHCTGA